MSKPEGESRPVVSEFERVRHILAGSIESRSEPGRQYQARIILEADVLCSCASMALRDNPCEHLKELYRQLDLIDTRRWIRAAFVVGLKEEA